MTDDWYVVRINRNESIKIPNICPVTLSANCSENKILTVRRGDNATVTVYKTQYSTVKLTLQFPIKDSEAYKKFNSFVKVTIEAGIILFCFKNKEYAELFAHFNSALVEEQSNQERRREIVMDRAAASGSSLLSSMGAIAVFIFIIVILVSN